MGDQEGETGASVDVVMRWYEALAGDDLPAVARLSTSDVEVRYPGRGLLPYGGAWHGRDGLVGWAEAHDEAEEILEFRIDSTVEQLDRVVVLGTFEGRARDAGRTWTTAFAHALTVSDGRVERLEAYFDTAAAVDAHRAPAGERS